MVGRDLVALGQECCVGVERRPRLTVTETAGHRAQVAARTDELSGCEVAEVVQPRAREPGALRDTPEGTGCLVGPVRVRALRRGRPGAWCR